jgi:hypothetical protein
MKTTILAALALIAALWTLATAAAETRAGAHSPTPATEITAIRMGSRVVYRYRDAAGHLVLVDEPPLGYAATQFENMPPPNLYADRPSPVDRIVAVASHAMGETLNEKVLRYAIKLSPLLLIALGLRWSLPYLRRGLRDYLERRRTVTRVLDRSGYDAMHGVILPLPNGRAAFFDHLVRTPAGLLVVESERDDDAKTRTRHPGAGLRMGRTGFAATEEIGNTAAKVDARVAAVKALAPGVPVYGRVVHLGRIQLQRAKSNALSLSELKKSLPQFRREMSAEGPALDAAWHSLRVRAGRDESAEATAPLAPRHG